MDSQNIFKDFLEQIESFKVFEAHNHNLDNAKNILYENPKAFFNKYF